MSISYRISEIVSVKEWRDLETGVGVVEGHSAVRWTIYDFLLDRHCISCTVFELLDVEKYRDLEIWVRGH